MDDKHTPATRFAADYLRHRQHPPFPWQLNAAEQLNVQWPNLSYITVPTGCGKTCIVDLWYSCSSRRRLIYVINRRIVVDTAYNYAKGLPVPVAQLRGGLSYDEKLTEQITEEQLNSGQPHGQKSQWWLLPDKKLALVSTIDQVGSALLGQAYGHGRKAAPVLQGLVGHDALWVVDEAHLETPFVETLLACQKAGADIDIVLMSATPEHTVDIPVFTLSDTDKSHPVLSRRIREDRLAKPHCPKGKGAAALAEEARRLRGEGHMVVLVVCNTVNTARETFEKLRSSDEAILITGRVRAADRDRHWETYLPRIGSGTRPAGVQRTAPGNAQQPDLFSMQDTVYPAERAPLYVVATSAIEVGADIDCDALVSEECEDEAQQIQRQGRVNRLGELDCAPVSIVKPEKPFALKKPVSPLWLPDDLNVRFDPAPWLHGYGEDLGVVDVVWRKDLPKNAAKQEAYFDAMPIMTHECMPVPRWSFKQWQEDHNHPAVWLDGGTAVVRSECGGADEWGWNPDATDAVVDVAEKYDTDENGEKVNIIRVRLHEDDPVPEGMKAREYPGGRVATPPHKLSTGHQAELLETHQNAVAEEAARLAGACGFDPDIFRDAGRLHDTGKADARFQLLLGGDDNRILAKSDPATAAPRSIAGVPKGWRHEFATVSSLQANSAPLLCYLIGVHHGHGRPWFGPPHDTPIEWVELVLELRKQFNPWELAAMEAVLRIADWRASAGEVDND